jgi:hypothetical protein
MGFSQPTVSLGDFYGSMVVSIWNSSMTFINQLFFSVGQGHVTNTGSISCAKTNNKLFNFSGLESHPFLVKLGIVHEHGFIIFIILHIHLCSWYSYYTSMFMMFILYIYVHDVHIIHLCSYIKCVVFFLHLDHPLAPWPWRFFSKTSCGNPTRSRWGGSDLRSFGVQCPFQDLSAWMGGGFVEERHVFLMDKMAGLCLTKTDRSRWNILY